MIAVDTNILVYAHSAVLAKHEAAARRLMDLAEGTASWALPVFCLGEFLRVVTHPKLFNQPFRGAEACRALERVLESPSLHVISPGPAYPELLSQAVQEADAVGNLVFDAQIVALCREAGVSVLLTRSSRPGSA